MSDDKDYYLTVGELRKRIADLPDDAKVFYQRIEDVYFKEHGWTTRNKVSEYPDYPDEWIRAFGVCRYRDDKDLYITAHY